MNRMKRKQILLIFMFLLCCLAFTGCDRKAKRNMEKKEKSAVRYYREKYDTRVEVKESSLNYVFVSPFGSSPTGDYVYQMSDGTTVTYLGGEDRFIDDKQYEEITEAIINEVWDPAVEQYLRAVEETEFFDEEFCVGRYDDSENEIRGYAAYYDGNLEDFLQKEDTNLKMSKGLFLSKEENPEEEKSLAMQSAATEFCTLIANKVPKGNYIRIYGASALYDRNSYYSPYIDEPGYLFEIQSNKGKFSVKRPCYQPLIEGLEVTADCYDFEYQPGDITLVEVPLEEMQQVIDDNYYSLPYKSEKNQGSGYSEPDQLHEKRDVLEDGKAYKVVISERLKNLEGVGEAERYSCYFRISPELVENGNRLSRLPANDSRKYTEVFLICSEKILIGSVYYIKEGDYLHIGKVHEANEL